METIQIKIERITYANQETGYVVLRGMLKNRQITAVGIIPEVVTGANLAGIEYQFQGGWQRSKYGYQFVFDQATLLTNRLYYFLAKVVKGLGEKTSRRLIDHYGESQLIEIIEKTPERLLEFKGIKEKKLAKIKTSWEKQKDIRELATYLLPYGITPNLIVRIYNHFERDAVKKIQENPYLLTEIRGIGFKTADDIASRLGIPYDSTFRIQAAVIHLLMEAGESDGHTYLPATELQKKVIELLNTEGQPQLSPPAIQQTFEQMCAAEQLLLTGGRQEDSIINFADQQPQQQVIELKACLPAYKFMEDRLLSIFQQKSGEKFSPLAPQSRVESFISRSEKNLDITFSPQQREILARIGTGRRRLYALSGYAGTGKSTISKAILELLAELFCQREEMVCCAFTGMASSRIRKLTGFPAFTIHTLLKYKGENNFEYNAENPLPYKVVLLDEAGMVNLQLFYRLGLAIGEETLLILVGDPAQLPPIGAGNIFGDLLTKPFLNHVSLTQIYRQDAESVLVYFANIIRTGKMPPDYEKTYRDFSFISQDIPNYFALRKSLSEQEMKQVREDNNEKIQQQILDLARKATHKLEHPAWDFQVLTPLRKGILGTEALNIALQDIFNRQGKNPVSRYGAVFREGDKVVHLQNKDMNTAPYSPSLFNQPHITFTTRRIFNGNVGIIRKIDHDNEVFYVLYPDYSVVRYNFDHIRDIIDIAYCLTVHKSQGSQYKYVAIPLTNSHFIMLNNRWFYTAITRAEKKVYLIGQKYAFNRACTNIEAAERYTFMGITD